MFSLSNPSYPDLVLAAPRGVASLHLNPLHPHMLALGLQVTVFLCVLMRIAAFKDGNVAVYNLERRGREPVFLSGPRVGKHRETVWQVNTVRVTLHTPHSTDQLRDFQRHYNILDIA